MMKNFFYILIAALLSGLFVSLPSILNMNIIQYVAGVLGFVVVLLSIAFFISVVSSPTQEKSNDQVEETKLSRFCTILKNFGKIVYNKCNTAGFALIITIIFIILIGVLDAYMSRNIQFKCNCIDNQYKSCQICIDNGKDSTFIHSQDSVITK